ncbi:MAG TPA: hypothetical protein VMV72_17830 [Verrucomicrobiae bacterium]|nr:hypothetical protein [Verrucomicrobiae bacterium]
MEPEGEIPGWLENVSEELRKQAFFPSVHARKSNAFKVGFWLGHGLAVLGRGNVEEEDAELQMIAKVTAGACHKPATQALEYFRGFALGLEKGLECPEIEVAGETPTFGIYMQLVRNFTRVEELRGRGGTARELADLLLTKMPAAQARRIGENALLNDAFVRRLRKICQRIGLVMASRGRPRRK